MQTTHPATMSLPANTPSSLTIIPTSDTQVHDGVTYTGFTLVSDDLPPIPLSMTPLPRRCTRQLFVSAHLEMVMRTGYANHDTSHGYDHALAVIHNGAVIARRRCFWFTEEEAVQVLYALGCHDILDYKMVAAGLAPDAAVIRRQLIDGVGEEAATMITHIHENCSWSKRATAVPLQQGDWMRKLVQDADWLEAIGEGGIQRCIEYTTRFGNCADVPARVCEHIREKLLLIPEHLNYPASRDIAATRVQPLLDYLAANENPQK